MIKHIVLFRFLPHAESADREANLNQAKAMLDALPQEIPEIISWQSGRNILESEESSDLALIADFASREDLQTYQDHPAHQAVVQFLRKVRSERRVIDYEI